LSLTPPSEARVAKPKPTIGDKTEMDEPGSSARASASGPGKTLGHKTIFEPLAITRFSRSLGSMTLDSQIFVELPAQRPAK